MKLKMLIYCEEISLNEDFDFYKITEIDLQLQQKLYTVKP